MCQQFTASAIDTYLGGFVEGSIGAKLSCLIVASAASISVTSVAIAHSILLYRKNDIAISSKMFDLGTKRYVARTPYTCIINTMAANARIAVDEKLRTILSCARSLIH